jgi:hypothetical protein
LALLLVDRVHHALGKHRPDDGRKGWLSGLDPGQGEGHPTRGGLRIGKQLPERRPDQPPDQELEWDRDGQYFHYLTQWMHALNQVALWTKRPVFNLWSRELADTAHRAFVQGAPTRRRMFWKMSIDLTRPLVASMGQHDALDGYVTCLELELTASRSPERSGPKLAGAASDFASMIEDRQLATDDPLGIGGLLLAAYRMQRLLSAGASAQKGLLEKVLTGALSGLDTYAQEGALREPAETRLAFRELGLAIGLHAVLSLRGEPRSLLRQFDRYAPLEAQIIGFWLDPSHQKSASFMEHLDINQVMLATSLAPEGYLGGAL